MRVSVLGLGLVGGSMAQALHPRHDVVGHDRAGQVRADARAWGLAVADDVATAVAGADLVVLAGPVVANDALLRQVPPGCLVTDVGSVKAPVVRCWSALPDRPRLVPGHPMAGAEKAGWAAARADLFADARWVLCPGPWAPVGDWLALCEQVLGLGAVVVPADPQRHDAAVALVSHAPHVLAAALATAVDLAATSPLARSLAAGSFRDLTRVAASPPGRTAEFCFANRTATAAVLRELAGRLGDAAARLEDDDADGFADLLRAGHAARDAAARARDVTDESVLDLRLDDDGWAAPLVALADAGGVVVDVERSGGAARLVTRRPA